MIQMQGRMCRWTSSNHVHEGRRLLLVWSEKGSTISDDSRTKSFDSTSAETLKETGTEKAIVGGCICAPDIGSEENTESRDQSGSLSEDQSQWNPEEIA